MKQKVHLIGAGPGDPLLITEKGKIILKKVDVILYDFLCHPNLLRDCKKTALKICVGKQRDSHSHTQEEIHTLIKKYHQENKSIARLKGGSPGIFGRLSEELLFLTKENIPYEIVPGVSSANAASELLGIPLSDRDFAHSIAFFTGFLKDNRPNEHIPKADTLVIFMGIKHLKVLCARLLETQYYHPSTPVCIHYKCSLAEAKTHFCTLKTLEKFNQDSWHPSIIILGKVVEHAQTFSWQHHSKLFQKKIVLLRPNEVKENLSSSLQLLGADVTLFSPYKIQKNKNALNSITQTQIKKMDVLIFTSQIAINFFFEHLKKQKIDHRNLHHLKIFCIGNQSKVCLEKHGIIADYMSKTQNSHDLSIYLNSLTPKKILYPCAEITKGHLEKTLNTHVHTLNKVAIYKKHTNKISDLLSNNSWIIFYSESARFAIPKAFWSKINVIQIGNPLTNLPASFKSYHQIKNEANSDYLADKISDIISDCE